MSSKPPPPGDSDLLAKLAELLPSVEDVQRDAPELAETAEVTAGLLGLFAEIAGKAEAEARRNPSERRGRPPSEAKIARVRAMASRPIPEIAKIVGLAESTVRKILAG